jgi:sn-glycerol 3-phosphate transport system ATP-binding protein
MYKGNVEQVGTPLDVYNRPRTRFVGSFIGSPAMNFLEGSFAADGTHFIFDGISIAIDPAIGKANAGKPAALGIRPEHARMVPAGTQNSVPATVDFVEELGAGRVIHSDINGSNFALSVTDHTSGETGQSIALQLPLEHVHLFSSETGIRLDAASVVSPAKDLVS